MKSVSGYDVQTDRHYSVVQGGVEGRGSNNNMQQYKPLTVLVYFLNILQKRLTFTLKDFQKKLTCFSYFLLKAKYVEKNF